MQQENVIEKNNTPIDRRFLRLEYAKQEILRQLYALGMKQDKLWEKKGFSLQAKTLQDLRVAAIMDTFTLTCFQPECKIFELTPLKWLVEMKNAKPDILFLESAWRGKDQLWRNKIVDYSTELYDLVAYCHKQKIPVVFWCKEDPPHTDRFMHVAYLADIVFTTDIDAVELYKRELGHNFVYHLHFAAQPRIHNPLELHERKDRFAFAGRYPRKYPDRCRVFDELSDFFIRSRGMDIYDRNVLDLMPNDVFPEKYKSHILGGLDATQIDIAYKGYLFGINMNSVQESQTMFARRVFELMASNTVVVSNVSLGLKNYFGDLTIYTDDPEEMEKKIQKHCDNRDTMDKFRLVALRKVLRQHLYEDRLDFIVSKVFGYSLKRKPPVILVCARVSNQKETNRVLHMFQNQSYSAKKLILVSDEVLSYKCAEIVGVKQSRQELPEAEYITWFNSDDWYGENYLSDITLTTQYEKFDVIGKEERYVSVGNDEVFSYKGATVIGVEQFRQELPEAEYVAWFNPDDWYGENYLLDMALATRYGEFDVIGKEERYVSVEGKVVRQSVGQAYKFQSMLPARRSMIRVDIQEKEEFPWQTDYRVGKILAIDSFNYCENWQEKECPVAADMNIPNQGISLEHLETAASLVTPVTKNFPVICISASEIASIELPNEYFSLRKEKYAVLESRAPETWSKWFPLSSPMLISMHLDENGKLPVEILSVANFKLYFRCVFYDINDNLLSANGVRQGRRERVDTPPFASTMQLEISPRGKGTAFIHQITIGENGFRMAHCCFIDEEKNPHKKEEY